MPAHLAVPHLCLGAPNHPRAPGGVPAVRMGVPAPRGGAAREARCRRGVNNAANPCLPTPSSPGFEQQHITLISRHEFFVTKQGDEETLKQIQTPGKGIHKKRVACSLQKTIAVSTTRSSSAEGESQTRKPDSPKRRELSSKGRNHPCADRAAASPPFQVTQDTPPLLVPGVLCVPPLVPQCGGIAVPAGDRSSPHPPVLCHLHSHLAPPSALCTPSHLAQGAHTFHTSHDLIPNGCSHIPVALHMPPLRVFLSP